MRRENEMMHMTKIVHVKGRWERLNKRIVGNFDEEMRKLERRRNTRKEIK